MCNLMEWVSLTINIVYFVVKILKLLFIYFVSVNLLTIFGKIFLTGFRLNYVTILTSKTGINYLDFKIAMEYFNELTGYFYCICTFLIYRCKYSKSLPNTAQYFSLLNSVKKSE